MKVTTADCCRYCANTGPDFTFRDAVLCYKTNEYRSHTEVCGEYKEARKE